MEQGKRLLRAYGNTAGFAYCGAQLKAYARMQTFAHSISDTHTRVHYTHTHTLSVSHTLVGTHTLSLAIYLGPLVFCNFPLTKRDCLQHKKALSYTSLKHESLVTIMVHSVYTKGDPPPSAVQVLISQQT